MRSDVSKRIFSFTVKNRIIIENVGYVEKAQGLLENNTRGFESIADPQQIAKLKENLRKYKELIDSYASGKSGVLLKEKALEEPVQKMNHLRKN